MTDPSDPSSIGRKSSGLASPDLGSVAHRQDASVKSPFSTPSSNTVRTVATTGSAKDFTRFANEPVVGHGATKQQSQWNNPTPFSDACAERDGQLDCSVASGHHGAAPQSTPKGTAINGRDGQQRSLSLSQRLRALCTPAWVILRSSWMNVLLVFVPIGIIVAKVPGVHGAIIFTMNCVAIIPLASMLSLATEILARRLGDAVGALLNVTFGNAVELIIFIIALSKNEIRIVQASLLGSILANLLLILGMCFFFGGLRFREQIYNSTVTQMSACLLSLSVVSLVLPTAFHASFSDNALADEQSLKISRGTSIILLLVYVLYLLFQLKSHAFMYESTPQHIVDAESTPGPAAGWLDSSSSEDSSSSSTDTDSSSKSRDTVRRKVRHVFRGGRRRKSSIASVDTNDALPRAAVPTGTVPVSPTQDGTMSEASSTKPPFPFVGSISSEIDDVLEESHSFARGSRRAKRRHKIKRKHRKLRREGAVSERGSVPGEPSEPTITERPETTTTQALDDGEPRRVDFATIVATESGREEPTDWANPSGGRRGFPTLRAMSVKNLAVKSLAPTVFSHRVDVTTTPNVVPMGPVPRVRYGIRRTNSLPDRLNQHQLRPPGAMFPAQIPLMALTGPVVAEEGKKVEEIQLSRNGAIVLLLVSTGLVALCAEFLVSSIKDVTSTGVVGEIFIGLIILPIVGNAAEHVTAVTVAMKNKMDLAIGVAVGSSIQIALFVTPLVVILGWAMNREMTLYFTLFETVCLFVSAFTVNFLVLDGRSNYLEGALLCATYVIIGLVAYFYPDGTDASAWGN